MSGDRVYVSVVESQVSVTPTGVNTAVVVVPTDDAVVVTTGGAASASVTTSGITDATAVGRELITTASAAAARTTLGVPAGSGTSTGTNTGDQSLVDYVIRPTNSTAFTALTAQTPNTLVTSSTVTFTAGDSTSVWASARTSGGVGVELSFDGGYSWQPSGAVAVGGTIKMRAVSPTYGGTDVVTLNVGGRSYTWSITSRDWQYSDLSDTTTLCDLRADATFYQDVTGTTAATTAGDSVGQWVRNNGLANVVSPSSGARLKLALASGVKVITGDGSTLGMLQVPSGGVTPPPTSWTFAARVRTNAVTSGAFVSSAWSNSARFYLSGSATVVGYYDDAYGINITSPAPTAGTWFFVGWRLTSAGLCQWKIHTSPWTTFLTGNPIAAGKWFKVGSLGEAMSAQQQVSDAAYIGFGLNDAGATNLCTQWGVSP